MSGCPSTVSTIKSIRTRVEERTFRSYSDIEVVQLSIVAAMRNPTGYTELLFGHRLVQELAMDKHGHHSDTNTVDAFSHIQITPEEYGVLCRGCIHSNDDIFLTCERNDEAHSSVIQTVQKTLQTTLVSPLIAAAWKNAIVRCACALAMRMEAHDAFLSTILGEIARGDMRNLGSALFDMQDEEDASDSHQLDVCASIKCFATAAIEA